MRHEELLEIYGRRKIGWNDSGMNESECETDIQRMMLRTLYILCYTFMHYLLRFKLKDVDFKLHNFFPGTFLNSSEEGFPLRQRQTRLRYLPSL